MEDNKTLIVLLLHSVDFCNAGGWVDGLKGQTYKSLDAFCAEWEIDKRTGMFLPFMGWDGYVDAVNDDQIQELEMFYITYIYVTEPSQG